jgi:hypothetical protein
LRHKGLQRDAAPGRRNYSGDENNICPLRDFRHGQSSRAQGAPDRRTEYCHQEKIMRQRIKSYLSTRRSFLRGGLAAPGLIGAALIANARPSEDDFDDRPTHGDINILRFLSALEILETDLWQQYNELGGIQDSEVPGGSGNKAYTDLLSQIDMDMPQYIHDNTEDEFTHFNFINAYLMSKGAEPVDLGRFRNLNGSTAPGAQNKKRLTNLMELTVDTSWWTRYRSRTQNPDFGDKFAPAIPGLLKGKFPAIPGDRQHGRIPLRHHRAGRQQPLPCAGAAGLERRSVAHPA